GCEYVRNGPIGMASFDVEPRCLPMRMYTGICPPSKPALIMCEPARDFWPLIPRPEYLPLPEPRPRPTRFRVFRACAGLRFERLRSPAIATPPPPSRGAGPF